MPHSIPPTYLNVHICAYIHRQIYVSVAWTFLVCRAKLRYKRRFLGRRIPRHLKRTHVRCTRTISSIPVDVDDRPLTVCQLTFYTRAKLPYVVGCLSNSSNSCLDRPWLLHPLTRRPCYQWTVQSSEHKRSALLSCRISIFRMKSSPLEPTGSVARSWSCGIRDIRPSRGESREKNVIQNRAIDSMLRVLDAPRKWKYVRFEWNISV